MIESMNKVFLLSLLFYFVIDYKFSNKYNQEAISICSMIQKKIDIYIMYWKPILEYNMTLLNQFNFLSDTKNDIILFEFDFLISRANIIKLHTITSF